MGDQAEIKTLPVGPMLEPQWANTGTSGGMSMGWGHVSST